MTLRESHPEDPPDQRRHLSGSILSVGASRAISLLAIAVASVVVARMLGPAGTGTYAIAHALLFVFTVLFELGLPQAFAYYVGREEWSGGPLARGAIGVCFLLSLPGAAAMLAGFALFGDSAPGLTWPMAVGLAVALPFSLLWRVGPQIALARERFEVFALLDASPALLLCPTSIAGAAIAGIDGAIAGLVVATVGSGLAVIVWLSGLTRGPTVRPAGGSRAVLAFGLPAWASELLVQVNLRIDLILVGVYVGAAAGGVYSVALSTTSTAWVVMAAFAISALPRSARLKADSERALIDLSDRLASDARTIRHAVIAVPPMAVAILLLLVVGIPLLYGDAFARSVDLGLILLPGSLLLGIGMTAIAILLADGESGRVLRVCLAVVPPTVLAYALAVPDGGETAAAIVSSLSYTGFTALAVLGLRRASGLTARELLLPRRSDLLEYRRLASRGVAWARRLH